MRTSFTIGSSKGNVSEFIRSADLWEFIALAFAEFAELSKCMGIGDVLAIPCEEVIYFPNDRHFPVECLMLHLR